nr:reverse transcriptase domain-containing protein [Tanacetum cinerariifolium]
MLKQKQQEKDYIQIQKFWNMFKQLHINITLAEALVLMPKYQKMLKALLSNKEKLQELANTLLNEKCSSAILKKLPEKLGDPGKFLIPCGFSELKYKALADLGASINLMPLSVWKKLGLPDLIPTQMALKLASRAICTPDGIARDVFVPVGKFTFPADIVIVDYESDPRVPLILERPFLRTARALIDVHGEEMILRDGDERLTLNMKHDTASYSNHPHRDSVNLINIFNIPIENCLEDLYSNKKSGNPTFLLHKEITLSEVTHEINDSKGCTFLSEELPDIDSFNDIHPHFDDDPLSGSTTFSANSLLEEFTDELALITYPPDYDDNLTCDIESDLREIEFLLYQGEDFDFKDSIDQSDLANCDDLFVDPTPEKFTDEQPPDCSFPPRFDVYPDDFLDIESDADNFDDDSFDSKGEKIKESELLIDQLDLPCDIHSEYDSFNSQDFSRDDDLPSPDNEDKEINLFYTPDYPIPSGIVDKDYESKRDILIPKALPRNNTLSFAEKEPFHFDIPLFSRPLVKPPDGDTGILNIKMMGTVEDKILVSNPPKNCVRCTRYGYLVDGPNCQGCALLRQELKENLVTYSPDFQNSFEPSNASTNVVNAPREPYNSLNDSPSISKTSSQNPPNINHCCYECGDPLDGISSKSCTCKSCGKDAHIGYNCPSKVPVISKPEPCDNQTIDELPQTLPSFHSTFQSKAESPFTMDSTPTYVDESPNVFNPPPQSSVVTHDAYQCQPMNEVYDYGQNSCYDSTSIDFDQSQTQQYTVDHPIFNAQNSYLDSQIQLNSTLAKIKDQMTSITSLCELACQVAQKKLEEKQIEEERAGKAKYWKLPVCYDDDDIKERSDSLDDNLISGLPPFSAITPDEPILSTEEPDNSLSMGDEHLDTNPTTESNKFIKSGIETLIPIPSESEGIPEHVCDVLSHDNSPPLDVSKDTIKDFSESNEEFSSTDDDSLSLDNIDYVEASPPDSELVSSEVIEIVIPKVGGIKASNDTPIPFYDPIISGTPPNLTPSGKSDFFSEVDAFLAVEDESTSSQFPKSYLDPEGDMLLFEAFLNDDHSSDFKTKSSSTSLNSLLEETNNFDNSLPEFTTFSNVPFDVECESDSSDDQSCFDEDVLEKIVSKPLLEEEIIPMESLRTHDSFLLISSKIDSLLDEFAGELTLLKSIPPRIDKTACDFKEDIRLIKKLLYDNSSPCPPEEFVSANSDAASESFSPSPILVKDSDSFMEEIDLFFTPDYPMSPSIVDKDYDSEMDILIRKDLPSNNSLLFAEKESFYFDIPLFSRPPAKPPDGDTGLLNIKMMGDQKAFMHKLMITLASHQEKSPDLLSDWCGTVKKFNIHRSHLNKCPMLIDGQNNHPLDVLLISRKGVNRIKTGQKGEAWRSREKSEAVTVKEYQKKDKIGSKSDKNGKLSDERLTLNMRHDTSSYSNQPRKESINLMNVFNNSSEDFLEDFFSNQPSGNPSFSSHPELTSPVVQDDIFDPEGGNVLPEKFLDLDSTKDLHPPFHVNPLSGSTTYSYSSSPLLKELADELALITFPPKYDDDLQFDVEFDLKEIEFLLHQDIDSSLKDLIDQKIESDTENIYDDPFDSKGEKIKESKLLIDELDLPCDFLLPSEYDSFIFQDFSRVDSKPSTNNEDNVFNPCILSQENSFEIITHVVQDKKLATSNASLMLEDFDPPLYEPLFFKEVLRSKMLLLFSSENEEKVFKPGIHTSEKVHSSRHPHLGCSLSPLSPP